MIFKNIKLGKTLMVSAIIAAVCSIMLLFIIFEEESIDDACIAIEQNQIEVAKAKIKKIKNINGYGLDRKTVLMAACEFGNEEMIQYVLEEGADPNKTVDGCLYPIELYCRYGYSAGIGPLKYLLDNGAAQSKFAMQPPIFHLAERFSRMTDDEKEEATEMAILLLKNGAPMEHNGTSLLHVAAQNDMADFFYTIVHTKEGAKLLTTENSDGLDPMEVALKYGAINVQKTIRGLEAEYKKEQELLEEKENVKEEELEGQDDGNSDDSPSNGLVDEDVIDSEDETTIDNNDGFAEEKENTSEDALNENDMETDPEKEEKPKGYYQQIYGD